MEKTIELDDKNKVSIIEKQDFIRLAKTYFKNGDLEKDVAFAMCDDFNFSGWIDLDLYSFKNIDELNFHFDRMDPLFLPLSHLINENQELVIDDDATRELNKKYSI